MRKLRTAVSIRGSIVRRNKQRSIFFPNIWIVQRVNVYGAAVRMIGQLGFSRNSAVIKAGCVIVCHGRLIIRIILVNQPYLFYGIFAVVQAAEDFYQILCDFLIAYQLPS